MKVTRDWLDEHIELLWSDQEIGERLTMAGHELEGLRMVPATEGGNDGGVCCWEFSVTPNRGDVLSVLGLARELSVLSGRPLRSSGERVAPSGTVARQVPVDETVAVRWPVTVMIAEGCGCSRYLGRVVSGVTVGPSPDWLRTRLEAVGMQSVNNVVDVTNLVMLDLGQPLHAFDLARLEPPILVRGAGSGEALATLSGSAYSLEPGMMVIADQRGVVALAGILGGEVSKVVPGTTELFLEAACFDPVLVARAGRRLGVLSESRYRFERGVDPEGVVAAMTLATQWIVALAGGRAGPLIQAGPGVKAPEAIGYRHERLRRVGGVDLSREEAHRLLAGLGCRLTAAPEGGMEGADYVLPPSYRHDLRREEDLFEEVVRLYGYDRVPSVLPRPIMTVAPLPEAQETREAYWRRRMVGLGYWEAVNYAFIGAELQRWFATGELPVALINPLSEDQAILRTSLVAGLVAAAGRNLSRGNRRLRLFESGRVFGLDPSGAIGEEDRLAGLLTGWHEERDWHGPAREVDFFDLKGDVAALLGERSGLGSGEARLGWRESQWHFLHPGQQAEVVVTGSAGSRVLGWLGRLHPQLQERLGLAQPLFLFELRVGLPDGGSGSATRPPSRYPAVERDLALSVPAGLPAGHLLAAVAEVDRELIREVRLFDRYVGAGMAEDRQGLGVTVVIQAQDRTLTDDEVQALLKQVVEVVGEQCGAVLRQ